MTARTTTYIVGLIVFTFAILAGITLVNEASLNDDDFIPTNSKYTEFQNTFNLNSTVYSEAERINTSLEAEDSSSWATLTVIGSLSRTGWNMLKKTPSTLSAVFGSMDEFFGIPSFVPLIITSLILVIIAFSIFSAIFKWYL